MANTKISQLPSWTGTAADLRWFVMNNSGESETYKYSGYSSPLLLVGTNNINNIYGLTTISNSTQSAIIGGRTNTITNSNVCYLFTRDSSITNGNQNVIIGGHNHNINGGAESGIFGGYSHSMTNPSDSAILGGRANQINAANACCGGIVIMGGQGNTAINTPGTQIGIMAGYNNSVQNTSTSSTIVGGENNLITSSLKSNILAGNNNTISGKENVVMVGTSGRTASANNTTYVENLHTYRTPSTEVQSVSSGTTFTCNLDNGAKSQFYLTGASTINITNVRDGASFMIKTETDGNYVMTWTATGGYTFVFEGGIKDPGNTTTDIFVFEVFGSVIYGSRRHNFT
jgi:hypothetical protein